MPVLPEFSLAGRVAILATSGGDQAPFLAQALAEAGASVFTIARTQPLLDAVLAGLFTPLGRGGGVDIEGVIGALESEGYAGWYVLEQDVALNGEPDPGAGPVHDAKASFA